MVLGLLAAPAKQSHAFEHLRFTGEDGSFSIAAVDLNDDGIDEHIRRKKADSNYFEYIIEADRNGDIVVLGELTGRNIMLGKDYQHGVRNLLLFQDESNDFSYDVYKWNPARLTFTSDSIKKNKI